VKELEIDLAKIKSRATARLQDRLEPLVNLAVRRKLSEIRKYLLSEYGFDRINRVESFIELCQSRLMKRMGGGFLKSLIAEEVESSLGLIHESIGNNKLTYNDSSSDRTISISLPAIPCARDYIENNYQDKPDGNRDSSLSQS